MKLHLPLLVVLIGWLAACGGGSSTIVPPGAGPLHEVTSLSGDVLIAVELNEEALPSGLSAEDITITAIDPPETVGPPAIAAFEFGPDGSRFEQPITVRVVLPATLDGVGISAALISSDGEREELDLSFSPLALADGESQVQLLIEHFSVLLITANGDFGHQLSFRDPLPEPEYTIGESFTVTTRVTRESWESGSDNSGGAPELGAPWVVRDVWIASANGPLTAGDGDSASNLFVHLESGYFADSEGQQVAPSPDSQSVEDGDGFWTKSQTFTCTLPGRFDVDLRVAVVESIGRTDRRSGSSHSGTSWAMLKAELRGECRLPPIVASAALPVTTYTIDLPTSGGYSFAWSGADCGVTSGDATKSYAWTHGGDDYPDCDHTTEAHEDTEITLLITHPKFVAECSYFSAASGSNNNCVRTK